MPLLERPQHEESQNGHSSYLAEANGRDDPLAAPAGSYWTEYVAPDISGAYEPHIDYGNGSASGQAQGRWAATGYNHTEPTVAGGVAEEEQRDDSDLLIYSQLVKEQFNSDDDTPLWAGPEYGLMDYEDNNDRLAWAINVLAGRDADREAVRTTELDVPSDELHDVAEARSWLGWYLNLPNPYGYTLNELAHMAWQYYRYPEETEEYYAADGLHESHAPQQEVEPYFEPEPATGPRTYFSIHQGQQEVQVEVLPSDSGNQGDDSITIVIPDERQTEQQPGAKPPSPFKTSSSGFHELSPRDWENWKGPILHRRPNNGRIRRWRKKVLAITGVIFTTLGIVSSSHGGDSPSKAAPASIDIASTANGDKAQHPEAVPGHAPFLAEEGFSPGDFSPRAEDQQTVDRMLALGGKYNPEARTGAIEFKVVDLAAELGYTSLTAVQIHQLTELTLGYMDERMPGGMNWQKATKIAPDTKLPYPSAATIQGWLDDITS